MITVLSTLFITAGLGAVGGLLNCLVSNELHMPTYDSKTCIWRPGWVGNVVVGAIVAPVIWGLYGPLAATDISTSFDTQVNVILSQIITSVGVGFSGGRIITLQAQKQADTIAKLNAATALETAMKNSED